MAKNVCQTNQILRCIKDSNIHPHRRYPYCPFRYLGTKVVRAVETSTVDSLECEA